MIRVRIAPSPTGFAHVGTAYTALFNYAFAKKNKGVFVVRVEDTDIERNVKGGEEAIFDGLDWLGINHDESVVKGGKYGPYRQSDKLEVYRKIAKDLVKKKLAYEDEGAIRFKNPGKDVSWKDLIKGEITFPGDQITDFVILKSNGYPTYNFAVVVDDSDMKISHVIRGEDHVSNTPRQIALYKALEKEIPEFAHHPTIRNKEHKKLSKRKDKVNIMTFREEGYLPEALVNFLCLLGWSHPKEKEIFDLKEFVELFSLDRVRKSGPIFDMDKLDWMNGECIRNLSDKNIKENLKELDKKWSDINDGLLDKIIPLVKERIKKLTEFENMSEFFFKTPKVDKKILGSDYHEHIKSAVSVLEKASKWSAEEIGNILLKEVEDKKLNKGDFFMNLRIAVMGRKVTPPFNESIEILGKEETIKRLKALV